MSTIVASSARASAAEAAELRQEIATLRAKADGERCAQTKKAEEAQEQQLEAELTSAQQQPSNEGGPSACACATSASSTGTTGTLIDTVI